MGAVIGALADRGYGVGWRVLDAQYFGVPQRRRRVFIVARRAGNLASVAKVLFERKSLRGDLTSSGAQGQETASTVGESSEIAGTITAAGIRCDLNTGGNNQPVLIEPETYVKVIRSGARDAEGNLPPEVWAEQDTAPTLNQFDQGDSRAVVVAIQGSVIGRSDTAGPGGKGHGEIDDPMFTLNTTDRHAVATANDQEVARMRGFGDYEIDSTGSALKARDYKDATDLVFAQSVRRLTPVECERLQGFPDGWTEGQADSHRYKQMGNAVAVPVVQWLIDGIAEVMKAENES